MTIKIFLLFSQTYCWRSISLFFNCKNYTQMQETNLQQGHFRVINTHRLLWGDESLCNWMMLSNICFISYKHSYKNLVDFSKFDAIFLLSKKQISYNYFYTI